MYATLKYLIICSTCIRNFERLIKIEQKRHFYFTCYMYIVDYTHVYLPNVYLTVFPLIQLCVFRISLCSSLKVKFRETYTQVNCVLCALFYRICDPLCGLDSEQVHLSSVSGILPWISQCLCLQCTHSKLIWGFTRTLGKKLYILLVRQYVLVNPEISCWELESSVTVVNLI